MVASSWDVTSQGLSATATGDDLRRAAVRGDLKEVSRLLDMYRVSPDEPGEDGNSALHLACLWSRDTIVQVLLAKGASAGARNRNRSTPLHGAAFSGCERAISSLVAAGAEVSAADMFGDTPLHEACRRGHTGVVERLLAAGARTDVTNSGGHTPYYAVPAMGAHADKTRLLLDQYSRGGGGYPPQEYGDYGHAQEYAPPPHDYSEPLAYAPADQDNDAPAPYARAPPGGYGLDYGSYGRGPAANGHGYDEGG
eukprot:CAMPEP_0182901328 /NCGR_PEP_ID=MMETSP0034_2-20130328/29571_1 /TAXON_ID=156128 /ORGANISM="Nephroselmis pyriformis, Strain CCMP717" /LENGTH=252 /DNA_ID=CAMNT_0025035729 /DNA_START=181 /DNA_END=935 /DNA_ORIENTATION=+